ncbi:MAG: helix-turn-helix transcriptional regulator [Bacteroidales bacterium]|jgi:plasmid maintenance system antidote protein VapI|nr:helix-turn-helix transcriptional regulator [Bacteroidales bacterium]
MEEIHIGELIRRKMKEERYTAAWLAKQLECDPSNIYKIFKNYRIDTDSLLKISRLLHHDFFSYYSSLLE